MQGKAKERQDGVRLPVAGEAFFPGVLGGLQTWAELSLVLEAREVGENHCLEPLFPAVGMEKSYIHLPGICPEV